MIIDMEIDLLKFHAQVYPQHHLHTEIGEDSASSGCIGNPDGSRGADCQVESSKSGNIIADWVEKCLIVLRQKDLIDYISIKVKMRRARNGVNTSEKNPRWWILGEQIIMLK